MTIEQLGWGPAFAEPFQEYADAGMAAARVVIEHRGAYVLRGDAASSGRRCRAACATSPAAPSTAREWATGLRTAPTRRRAGADPGGAAAHARRSSAAPPASETVEQVIAANVDVLYLVSSMNGDLNPQRIERYLTLAWESGASPVVVLTKADLCDDVEGALALVEAVTFGVPVHVTSAPTGEGIAAVRDAPRRRTAPAPPSARRAWASRR